MQSFRQKNEMITCTLNRTGFIKNNLEIIGLLAVLCACGHSRTKQADFLDKYGGNPYMGTVKVNIITPDGTTAKTEYGDANAHFTEKAKGQAQMVLFGAIREKKGDAGFVVDGPYKGTSWKTADSNVVLEVDANGKFSGGGELKTQKFTFSGDISVSSINFVLGITELEKTEGGYPAGTAFVFNYSLSRINEDVATTEKKTSGTAGKKKCKKIVWQTRYIGHFDGSGSTVRVPVCMD